MGTLCLVRRFWDLAYPERSYIVAGGANDSLHCPSVLYSRKIIEGTEVVQVGIRAKPTPLRLREANPGSQNYSLHSVQLLFFLTRLCSTPLEVLLH